MEELDGREIGVAFLQNAPDALLGLGVLDQNAHAFHARQMTNDLAIQPRDRLEFSRPVGFLVRPGEPGGLVRLPLGRHPEAQRARRGRVRRHWSSHRLRIGP
jgi:hypothetical protein